MDPSTQLGPLANIRRIEAMDRLISDATERGARLLAGGSRVGNRGYFYPITVLADLPDDARAMNQRSRPASTGVFQHNRRKAASRQRLP